MPKLRDTILAQIQSWNIRPRPRWQYILLHVGLWVTGIVTIIVGSFACAYMFFEFSLPERAYFSWMETQENNWIEALPYLWGIGMVFALTFGYFIFSKTERWYRFRAGIIALVLIFGSLLGWWILFHTHTIHWWDRQIQRLAPGYRDFRQGFAHIMPRPEDGILPLRISKIEGKNFIGMTPDGQMWTVSLLCQDKKCFEQKAKLMIGKPTLFGGMLTGDHIFNADRILPRPKMPPHFHDRLSSGEVENLSEHSLEKKGE